MSSSYVEVRESENGTAGDMMQFQINDCENGLDIRTQGDGEPPKDHTYNKDPAVDQMSPVSPTKNDVEISDNENSPKKSGRTPRNIKHKFIKPREEERAKSPLKKESVKKSARTKAAVSNADGTDVEKNKIPKVDSIEETLLEPDSPKKRDRKRKSNDKIADEEPNQKQSKKKKSKSSSEKELEEELEEDQGSDDLFDLKAVKEETPIKKSKNAKAKSHKKVEKTPASKTPKKEIEETPKSKAKPVKREVGEAASGLPHGWTRKVVERKSGKTAGMFDVYIYSPEGLKFRSRPDIAAYLEKTKSKLRADDFSFKRAISSTEIITPASSTKKSSKPGKVSKSFESQKKKSIATPKKGTKLKVKIHTPKKQMKEDKSKMKASPSSPTDSQPSTSGLQSKRTGGNKKKKTA